MAYPYQTTYLVHAHRTVWTRLYRQLHIELCLLVRASRSGVSKHNRCTEVGTCTCSFVVSTAPHVLAWFEKCSGDGRPGPLPETACTSRRRVPTRSCSSESGGSVQVAVQGPVCPPARCCELTHCVCCFHTVLPRHVCCSADDTLLVTCNNRNNCGATVPY